MKRLQHHRVRLLVLLAILMIGGVLLAQQQNQQIAAQSQFHKQSLMGRAPSSPFQMVRAAEAESVVGDLDALADSVYGQDDFNSGDAPTAADDTTLNFVNDVFVFDTGQIFVADTTHNRVLGWHSVDTYQIGDPADIVLGQPDFTSTAALNPPNDSSMNAPTGLTLGFDGFLYVSDTGNNRILVFVPCNDFYGFYDEVDENGDVVGSYHDLYGCAESDIWTETSYEYPFPAYTSGMDAYYALGQPDMSSGTALPTSTTSLDSPMGLVTDVNDNLVVADHGNNRVLIYEWPLYTGVTAKWIAGQGSDQSVSFTTKNAPNPPTQSSMNGPTGVAVNTEASALYVADNGNNRILVFNDEPIDPVADRVIGQPDFTSNAPNHNSVVSALGFDGLGDLKMDAGNRLFVADTNNNRVLVFDETAPDGTADVVFGQPDFASNSANNGGIGDDTLFKPTGIATDAFFMDVYIADSGNHRVLQYSQPLINPAPVIEVLDPGSIRAGSTGFSLIIQGSGMILDTVVLINGVERAADTDFLGFMSVNLLASELNTAGQDVTITLSNPAPGGGTSNVVTLSVYEPAAGDDSADTVLGQKGFTTDDGAFSRLGADTLYEPSGMIVDPTSGRIFVADTENSRILSWSDSLALQDGQPADLVIGQANFEAWGFEEDAVTNIATPVGLALDSQGNLYAADAFFNRVQVYQAPLTSAMPASLTINGFFNPLDVVLDAADNLYVVDALNHRVLFYETPLASNDTTPDGVFGQVNFNSIEANQGGAASASTLNFPTSATLDPSGNLYVSDGGNNRVLVYTAVAGTIDDSADFVFGQPNFSDTAANQGGAASADTLNLPHGLTFDAGGTLYVADMDNQRVLGYETPLTSDRTADIVYGQGGSFRQSRVAQTVGRETFNQPTDVTIAADGSLFISDNTNNRVVGFLQTLRIPTAIELQTQTVATPLTPANGVQWVVAVLLVTLGGTLVGVWYLRGKRLS